MDRTYFVTILFGIIIACAMMNSFKKNGASLETFANVNHRYPSRKSALYFLFLAPYFMSDTPSNVFYNRSIPQEQMSSSSNPLQIFKFLPTYLDASCILIKDLPKDLYCQNFYIDNISSPDQSYTDTSQTCTNVQSSVGVEPKHSLMRILGFNYAFKKRCVQMHIASATSLPDGSIKIVTRGNMDLFQLLRPCFIAFSGFGLFAIQGTQKMVDNSMVAYSNNIESPNHYFLTPVTHASIYPANQQAPPLITALAAGDKKVFTTIYYPDLAEAAIHPLPNFMNTLTLVFDSDILAPMTNTPVAYALTRSQSQSNLCASIVFNWMMSNEVNVFYVTMDTTVSNGKGTRTKYPVHPHFSMLARQANAASAMYHVVVTYTVDLLIIVGFFKDLAQGNVSQISMMQYPVRDIDQAVYLESSTVDRPDSITQCPSIKAYGKLVQPYAIPNFSMLSKQLGYSLSNPPI